MVVGRLVGWLGPQHLLGLARRVAGNSEFLITPDERLTRRQLFARADALAAGLQLLGAHKGERIAALLPPCAEAAYALLLPWLLGTVEVLLDPALPDEALRHALAQSGARFVLTTRDWRGRDLAAAVAGLRPQLPDLRYVLAKSCGRQENAAYSLEGLIASGTSLWRARVSAKEEGRIAYLAGRGDPPRGIVHTRGAYWRLASREVATRLDPPLFRCLLLPFPLHSYAGWLGLMATLILGDKVVLMDGFQAERALELVERERVTLVVGTPAMLRALTSLATEGSRDFASLQLAASFGPCPPELARAIRERLGCPVASLYAREECGLISCTDPFDPPERAATVGRPVPGVQVRIVDAERRPLPRGKRGQVAVRSPQMMAGYHGAAEATAQALDREGWFYTGDEGWVGDDGDLRLCAAPARWGSSPANEFVL